MVKKANSSKQKNNKKEGKARAPKKAIKGLQPRKTKSNKKNKKNQNNHFSAAKLKTANSEDLITELKNMEENQKLNPSSKVKNKDMRKHLVLLRNLKKNLIKGKLRRKNQKLREDNPELEKDIPMTKTIDNQRETDDTYINEEDPELIEENKNDEYSSYYNNEYEPQIMITTAVKYTSSVFKLIKELTDSIPNCYFYYRKNFTLKQIVDFANEKKFSDVIVIQERLRQPYRMIVTHLPEGPTVEFKISNVYYHDEIEHRGIYILYFKQRLLHINQK